MSKKEKKPKSLTTRFLETLDERDMLREENEALKRRLEEESEETGEEPETPQKKKTGNSAFDTE